MNPSRNDVTGDPLVSKSPTNSYRDGWERIFGNKTESPKENTESSEQKEEPGKEK